MTMSTKLERKLQDRINYISKRAPGKHRILELYRLAMELDLQVDDATETEERQNLVDDALYLRRMAHDLMELRGAIRGNPKKTVAAGRGWMDPPEVRP